jgi:hemolysin activation/secretion protein
VTPRRKLIRAQDKIDQELREMREREKEFALRRAFKSTPDLSQESKDEENNNNIVNANVEAQPKPIIIRNKEGTPEIKERRRSALINQWEEKIQTAN